jgi:uroporphyrinogen decarboxylase
MMTSAQRVFTTIGQSEPDRVPYFLLLSLHGAKELDMSIEEYFSKAQNVYDGQIKLREKYGHDCYYSFFYTPIEVEAFGADVIYSKDGPPNAGAPFLNIEDIKDLKAPIVKESKSLQKVLEATAMLKKTAGDDVPIIGVVVSPFSLPVMQLGFDKYLDLIYNNRELFDKLMDINIEFCVNWSNAQLEAGATAICYFDPVSSSTIVPRDLYLQTGYEVAKRTIGAINGPTATHFASGNCIPIIKDVANTGTAVVGVSSLEDLAQLKKEADGKLTLLGNLNAIEMRHWSVEETEQKVKEAISKAAIGGGFILAENHGEIPWDIKEETLFAIRDAVLKYGTYPIKL